MSFQPAYGYGYGGYGGYGGWGSGYGGYGLGHASSYQNVYKVRLLQTRNSTQGILVRKGALR